MKSYIANLQTPKQSTIFSRKHGVSRAIVGTAALLLLCAAMLVAQERNGTIPIPSAPFLPSTVQVVSTVPSNGDVNPYGVAFVPHGFPGGVLTPGDILVSNFNNAQNLQGTGTTIVRACPSRDHSRFSLPHRLRSQVCQLPWLCCRKVW